MVDTLDGAQADGTAPRSAVEDMVPRGTLTVVGASRGANAAVFAKPQTARGEETTLGGLRTARPFGAAAGWITRRHSFAVEVLMLALTYVAYDAGRGLVRGGTTVAIVHARSIASLERSLGIFHEIDVQRTLVHVPGLTTLFAFGYDVLHLAVTGGVLLWLFFRQREAYPRVRTTLLAATGLALVCFTVFPSAPPRLAGIGIADTLSLASQTSHSGLLQFLYNPYAAMPSLHMAYAVIAGASLFHWGRHAVVRVVGMSYPIFVAVEVIATGNHFFLDVAMGLAIVACALAIVSLAFAGGWSQGVRQQAVGLPPSFCSAVGTASGTVPEITPVQADPRASPCRLHKGTMAMINLKEPGRESASRQSETSAPSRLRQCSAPGLTLDGPTPKLPLPSWADWRRSRRARTG
jgi:hypothetical protein